MKLRLSLPVISCKRASIAPFEHGLLGELAFTPGSWCSKSFLFFVSLSHLQEQGSSPRREGLGQTEKGQLHSQDHNTNLCVQTFLTLFGLNQIVCGKYLKHPRWLTRKGSHYHASDHTKNCLLFVPLRNPLPRFFEAQYLVFIWVLVEISQAVSSVICEFGDCCLCPVELSPAWAVSDCRVWLEWELAGCLGS